MTVVKPIDADRETIMMLVAAIVTLHIVTGLRHGLDAAASTLNVSLQIMLAVGALMLVIVGPALAMVVIINAATRVVTSDE